MSSVSSFLTRWPKSALPLTVLHHRVSPVYVLQGVSLRTLTSVSADDVIDAIRRLPDKCLAADPVPTYVMKRISDIIAPFVAELFNRSPASGRFPAGFKETSITPVMKSRASTPPTPPRIDPSPICRYCRNYSSGSWCVS